jgi:hypothetical protein
VIPAYRAVLPDNITIYTLCFPSWKAFADAAYQIIENDVAYGAHRQYNMHGCDLKGGILKILTDPTKTLNDLEELVKDPKIKKQTEEMKIDFQFILAGMTQRDKEYKEELLDKILANTGGWKASMTEEDEIKRWSLLYMIRMGHKNLNFLFAGGYEGAIGLFGIPDFGSSHMEEASEFKRQWEKKGAIALSGGDSEMGGIAAMGGGGTNFWEFFTHFDPYDKESVEGCYEFFLAEDKYGREHGWGPSMQFSNTPNRGPDGYATSKEEHEKMLEPMAPILSYQWKVKQALDPNDMGDRYYQTVEPKK